MPDVSSIPPTPSRSRRPTGISVSAASTTQPQLSPNAVNILPSNQQTVNAAASQSSLPSPGLPSSASNTMSPPPAPGHDGPGIGAGPGPIRHPRPLTAAELHSELEQEQELLVNRLTRDLTMLRATHNSSVVSNASSASASNSEHHHSSSFTDTHLLSGPGFHIPPTSAERRHHRTSSSTSTRSFSQLASQGSTSAPIPIAHHSGASATSILEAARNPRGATSMSRQNSTASHRSHSRNHSPAAYHHHGSNPSLGGPSSYTHSHHGFPYGPDSASYFRHAGATSTANATPGSEVLSPGLLPATHRYEETAFYRSELDTAKRENDALKKRVKELEKMLREQHRGSTSQPSSQHHQQQQQQQQQSADPSSTTSVTTTTGSSARERTDSVSTTASAVSLSGTTGVGNVVGGGTGIAPGRRPMERAISSISYAGSVGVGVPDEEVKVGESAASGGLRKGSASSSSATGGNVEKAGEKAGVTSASLPVAATAAAALAEEKAGSTTASAGTQ